MEYEYDFSKLRGRIIEKFGSISNFVKETNLSEPTVYNKLNAQIELKQSEILDFSKILDIKDEEIHIYFFARRVKKS